MACLLGKCKACHHGMKPCFPKVLPCPQRHQTSLATHTLEGLGIYTTQLKDSHWQAETELQQVHKKLMLTGRDLSFIAVQVGLPTHLCCADSLSGRRSHVLLTENVLAFACSCRLLKNFA